MKNIKILILIFYSLFLFSCTKNIVINQPEIVSINIKCVGDIMAHMPQIQSALRDDGSYNFDENYKYLGDIFKNSDISICNLETTFADNKYSGYPQFCAPSSLAKSLKDIGFNIIATANNHMYDRSTKGLKRTIEILDKNNLAHVGSSLNEVQKQYIIYQTQGINIAIFNYTYETTSANSSTKTINTIAVKKEDENLINSFNLYHLDNFIDNCKNQISLAKNDNADVIVFYLHWGNEYQNLPDKTQIYLAKNLAQNGADIIFGSHPHVVQKYEVFDDTTTGRQIPIFYSLGNFISNQRREFTNNPKTEDSIIAIVDFNYDKSLKRILSIKADYIPAWTNKFFDGSRYVYNIIPLTNGFENLDSIKISKSKKPAKEALKRIIKTLK